VAAKSRDDPRVAALLAEAAPDVVVIAKYPWILPMTVFQTSRLGAINLHPALLPRHRGPLPLFWIYHGDDRESGVTAHWVTAEVDAGPIAGRTKIPVPRGLPVDDLSRRNGEIAGPLALAVLADIDSGTAAAEQQDDDLATAAPYLSSGRPMVDFEAWPVERVWHFLAGLFPRFQEPLRDQGNRPARYYGVTGYTEAGHSKALGRVERQGQEWSLGCRGGFVRLRATRGPRAIE
jgi:methionyl-tRNA formyltransferase